MIRVITTMRRQRAVWWERGAANHYGEYAFSEPVEIKCRWEDRTEEYKGGPGPGETRISQAVVYVDRVMKKGDYLKRGAMDSNTPETPQGDKAAFEIVDFAQLPDLRNKDVLLTAYL